MISAGQIGIEAVFDDSKARAKAAEYVAWMRQQMASVSAPGPAVSPAGGGFFNRMSGGGNVSGASGAGGGGFGGFRPFSFDAEAEQVRGGLRTLARALYGQAVAIGQMGLGGGGGGGRAGIATALLMNGSITAAEAGPIAGLIGGNVGGRAAAAAEASFGGEAAMLAGGAGFAGKAFTRLGTRLARAGGWAIAAHGITSLIGAYQDQNLKDEDIDEMERHGNYLGSAEKQLAEAKSMRSGFSGWWRERMAGLPRGWTPSKGVLYAEDWEGKQKMMQETVDRLKAGGLTDSIREESVHQHQAIRMERLSGHSAAMQAAKDYADNAREEIAKIQKQADDAGNPQARAALLFGAHELDANSRAMAAAMRWKANQGADTIGIGLGFDIQEQNLRNALRPGAAHALSIYASTAEHIRDLMINSTPENAELARKLGISQEEGFRIQTIMSGRGSSFDPTAELVGPQPGSGSEQVLDILKAIDEKLSRLLSESVGDIGGTGNPLDMN